MNKFRVLYLMLLFMVLPSVVKADVLMSVDGNEISVSEFLCYYNRASRIKPCTPMEYFPYFLKHKIKVADAEKRGLADGETYRQNVNAVKSCLSASGDVGKSTSGFVKINMITYKVSQKASSVVFGNADRVMREIRRKLLSGMSFEAVADSVDNPDLCFENYAGKWQDRTYLLDEINREIDKLGVGTLSDIIYSPEGVHLVLLKDKCNTGLCSDGTDADIMEKLAEEMYLVSEWEHNTALPYKEYSEESLKKYFKNNKKKYKWELPHYKGAVIHCSGKKVVSRLKRKLKKQSFDKWPEIMERFCATNGMVKYNVGLFVIGSNEYVDKLAFKCGAFESKPGYPYTHIIGKRLDYTPDDYNDVRKDVLKDYIKEGEERFFKALEKKLNVETHLDVLKTVNCSASN